MNLHKQSTPRCLAADQHPEAPPLTAVPEDQRRLLFSLVAGEGHSTLLSVSGLCPPRVFVAADLYSQRIPSCEDVTVVLSALDGHLGCCRFGAGRGDGAAMEGRLCVSW